jgi:ribosomal-protein-alanine N-acetyltransferase
MPTTSNRFTSRCERDDFRNGYSMNVVRVSSTELARFEACARLMADSEPWITLKRSFQSALVALQDPGKELHVVLDAEDAVVAFILLDLRGPLAGYIQSICVRHNLRGQGLGTGLMAWAERRISQVSPNVFLCVSSFNVGARRLYERLGYEMVGRLPDFLVHGHDELLFRKTLGPWNVFESRGHALGTGHVAE